MVRNQLLESIFELRWELSGKPNRPPFDANYKILLGRFFDRAIKEYPYHNDLPSSNMPDEISANIIQHQFRIKKDKWPLIQLGQGIATLNDTNNYDWPDFKNRSEKLIDMLFDAYPDPKKFKVSSLLLRYINGIEFNFDKEDSLEFLKMMRCELQLKPEFFGITGAKDKINAFNFQFNYPIDTPKGVIKAAYAKGQIKGNDAIIWEIGIHSAKFDVPKDREAIVKWVDTAHEIPHKWFKAIKTDIGGI